ncbi:MAG TPA: electron transport complex subunit RsxB [Ottowia sp.]|uniref:electron transport complex subunit RsxB n=1 Tax=Ottowia sp. TaxID=1898956 RepID=UPI002D0F4F27|nr:electron transport complex subunit RsxB [Ottowia sp.]HMN20793.1 electron transport complex subunit RsxB [Ottowia sp.]
MTKSREDSQEALAQRLLGALPQTQCTRCGYPDCLSYARAIAAGDAAINQCPPGGAEGVRRLAALTGQPALALNPQNGVEGPRAVAWIDENWCIGCTLCIAACPVDCIVGSHKCMHTVIESDCTGCELCVAACPVDCIQMEPVTGSRTGWAAWSPAQAEQARASHAATQARRARAEVEPAQARRPAPAPAGPASVPVADEAERKRAVIAAALARARARQPTS